MINTRIIILLEIYSINAYNSIEFYKMCAFGG